MKKLVQRLYRIIKKSEFILDPGVSNTYLLALLFEKIFDRCRGILALGFARKVYIAPRSKLIAKNKIFTDGVVVIGRECTLDALSKNGISIGHGVSFGAHTVVKCTGSLQKLGIGCSIGRNVGIGDNSFLGCAGGINIGDDVIIGNFVSFHSENHIFIDSDTPIRLQGTTSLGINIGPNCWIGAKATVLDGVNLGSGCIVGAGSVLTKGSYPDNSIIVGVPAKVIRKRI